MNKKLVIMFSVLLALLCTGFIGTSVDMNQAQAWGRWGAGSGPARRLLGVERRQARRHARQAARSCGAGSYSGYSTTTTYTSSSCPTGNCPTGNCGTLSRWR